MQSGLSSVGVNCLEMSYVSSDGGKYGRRQTPLNTRCKPRNGGMFNLKLLSLIVFVMVSGLVVEASDGLQ